MHWVKIDFNKWKDEDDLSDEEGGGKFDLNDVSENKVFVNFLYAYYKNFTFFQMMGQMGGFGGEKPDLDDLVRKHFCVHFFKSR